MDAYLIGAERGVRVVKWCRELGVRHWSVFGTSCENMLKRPQEQVEALYCGILRFCEEAFRLPGVTLHIFGNIAEIPISLPGRTGFLELHHASRTDGDLVVHVGLNYAGSVDVMKSMVAAWQAGRNDFGVPDGLILSAGVPNVDLLIRTGGHQRLSGFIPLHLQYAELWFEECLWADLTDEALHRAFRWYAEQDRTFGE